MISPKRTEIYENSSLQLYKKHHINEICSDLTNENEVNFSGSRGYFVSLLWETWIIRISGKSFHKLQNNATRFKKKN